MPQAKRTFALLSQFRSTFSVVRLECAMVPVVHSAHSHASGPHPIAYPASRSHRYFTVPLSGISAGIQNDSMQVNRARLSKRRLNGKASVEFGKVVEVILDNLIAFASLPFETFDVQNPDLTATVINEALILQ
jgi:hypothetical protein